MSGGCLHLWVTRKVQMLLRRAWVPIGCGVFTRLLEYPHHISAESIGIYPTSTFIRLDLQLLSILILRGVRRAILSPILEFHLGSYPTQASSWQCACSPQK